MASARNAQLGEAMAKNGIAKGLEDILLQGLGAETMSSVSSRRVERQQLREEREERQAERAAGKKGEDDSGTVAPASGKDEVGDIGGGPVILNIVLSGTDLNEILTGTDEVDSLYGGGGDDIIIGLGNSTGAESLFGGTGNDRIFGNSNVDSAYGGDGNDVIEGNHGNDFLEGNDGNDTLLDGPTTGSADQVVSVSATGEGGAQSSESHRDILGWAAPLGDGSGYITGWATGIGAPQAPPQALKLRQYDNFGQPVGEPVRIDTYYSAPENLGPFELKDEIRLLGLQGEESNKFVVVFESEFQDQSQGNRAHTYMLVFNNNNLSTDIAQFQFSTQTDRTQQAPTVVALNTAGSAGDLIVAWQEDHRDNNNLATVDSGIYFRKYEIDQATGAVSAINGAASGTVVGNANDDYRVNVTTNGDQVSPEMLLLSNGNVLVGWNSNGNTGEVGDFGVYFRILNYSGATPTAVTGEIRANVTTAGNQEITAKNIAQLTNGNIVITWNGNGSQVGNVDSQGTFFRIFNQSGTAVTGEILANTGNGLNDIEAAVAALPDGGFFVVWARDIDAGAGVLQTNYEIFGRQFDANGNPTTAEFQINTNADPAFLEDQLRPHIAVMPNGLVVITWDSGRHPDNFPNRDEELIQQVFVFSPSTGGNDTMNGGSGQDVMLGQSGNDSLFGGAGNFIDTLSGGSGSDVLHGDSGADSLFGGFGGDLGNDLVPGDFVNYAASNAAVNVNLDDNLTETGGDAQGDFITGVEHIVGSQFNDSLTGIGSLQSGQEAFAPNNSIIGGSGADHIFGLDGNDSLFGDFLPAFSAGGGNDSVFGGAGNDLIFGGHANDHLDGGAGGDTIGGDTGDDVIFGFDGADSLSGDLGNDTITGGADADSINGGGGSDTASYDGSHLGVYVNLTDASPESFGHAEGDVLTSIENLIGSSQADTLITSSGAEENAIFGGDGNDTMDGRGGADSFNGGTGQDWVYYNDSGAAVNVNLVDAAVEAGGFATGDFLTFVENLLGSHFDDTLVAGVRINTLNGATGNDFLQGGAEADVLIGGIGIDTASYDSSPGGVTVDLSDDAPEVGNDAQGDTLTQVENLIGSSFNDHLIADDGINTVVAGDSDDTVEGGDGADSLFGGTGFDWVDYTNSDWGVTVTLGSTNAQTGEIDGDQIGDVLSGFEAVKGANDSDIGDTLTSVLSSAILDGQLGDDFFIAGAGADTFIGGFGSDTVDYRLSGAGVTVNLATGLGAGGLAAGDLYTGVENVLGSSFVDTLIGIAGFSTLAGFDGNDSLFGGSSTDSLVGGNDDDYLQGGSGGDSLIGGAGDNDFAVYTNDVNQLAGVTVDLTTGRGSGGDAGSMVFDPDENTLVEGPGDTLFGIEHLIGSGNNDSLSGDGGVNWLFGASGADALIGQGGNDTLYGDDGDDRLGGFAPGAVDLGADSLFGGSGNDAFFFDPNDAALVGGVGNDTLVGRSIADQVQLDAARFNFNGGFADIEQFELGDGNDVFLNTSSVSDLVDIGTGLTVFGGSGRDQISMRGAAGVFSGMDDIVDGGAGNDIIWGGFGNDGLNGGANDDQLYGGKGDDKFDGGSGFDVFYVGHDEGTDIITDNLAETNGLVLFWGWDSTFGGNYDGIDPTEVTFDYTDPDKVTITLENGGEVSFDRFFNGSTWETSVDVLNLWDYGNGDAGNSPTPPTNFARDVWSATFDASTGLFTAFTLAVNG